MGNVAYTLTGEHERSFSNVTTANHRTRTVVFADMGEFTFAPSREALSYTPRTMSGIDRYVGIIKADLEAKIKADLDNADSYSDAFTLWSKWGDIVGDKNMPKVQFQGKDFVDNVDCQYGYLNLTGTARWNRPDAGLGDKKTGEVRGRRLPMAALLKEEYVFITDFPNTTAPAGGSRQKLNKYLEDNGKTDCIVYFFPGDLPGDPWTSEVETVKWEDIKSINIGTGARVGNTGKIPVVVLKKDIQNSYFDNKRGTYGGYAYGEWEEKVLDSSEPILYCSPAEIRAETGGYSFRLRIANIQAVFPKAQIVRIGANRFEKFVRDNPGALHVNKWYDTEFHKRIGEQISADAKWYATFDRNYHNAASKVKDASDDPNLTRLWSVQKNMSALDKRLLGYYNGTTKCSEFIKDYPLFRYGDISNVKHSVLYINAVIKEGN
jgi:hypothetical protein